MQQGTMSSALPPQIRKVYGKVMNAGNDLLHTPVLEELMWYVYWAGLIVLSPLYLVGLVLLFLYDLYSGFIFDALRFEDAKGRAVLITGCDTGFGHDLALTLYEKGWKVYAGCLSAQGIKTLQEKGSGNLIPVQLDVTNEEHIAQVYKKIDQENPDGLFALVNNAGKARFS
jgi:hypothetical protein